MIDDTVEKELAIGLHVDQISNPRDNSYIRASGIGDCRRKLYYRVKWHEGNIAEQPIWAHGLFTFDMGHGIHLQLQQRLSNVGGLKWVDAEPEINPVTGRFSWRGNCEIDLVNHEYRVAGHCDALTKPLKRVKVEEEGDVFETLIPTEPDDLEGIRYLIDIKSITARERLIIDRDPEVGAIRDCQIKPSAYSKLMGPKPEHVQQASLYAWLTTLEGFSTDRISSPLPNLPEIMIIYVAKDLDPQKYQDFGKDASQKLLHAPYKVFTFKTDPLLVEVIKRKLQFVWEHIDNSSLPPRDYNHTPSRPAWACVDCPFRKECYSKEGYFEDEEVSLPAILNYRMRKAKEDETTKFTWI